MLPAGLDADGWQQVDELLAKANKEQIKVIVVRAQEKLLGGQKWNQKKVM